MSDPILPGRSTRECDVLVAVLLALTKRGSVLRVNHQEMDEAFEAIEGGPKLVLTTRTEYNTITSGTSYEITRTQEGIQPMALWCFHAWGFPRRHDAFDGHRNIDVQTCAKCGRQRISPVQFGPAASQPSQEPQLVEVRA